jgi:hypothetical protein
MAAESGGLSKAQRDLRRTEGRFRIGSSEIGVVAGLSPYGSTLELWAEKVRGLEKDETGAMEFGTAVEESVARIYVKRTGEAPPQAGDAAAAQRIACLHGVAGPGRAAEAREGGAAGLGRRWSAS